MKCFESNQIYSIDEIIKICNKNDLTTVDCLKDENMITIEEFIDGELGGECLFEFLRIGEDSFKLVWQL